MFKLHWSINGKVNEHETENKDKARALFDGLRWSNGIERVFLSDGTKQLAAYSIAGGLIAWSDTLGMMVSIPDA